MEAIDNPSYFSLPTAARRKKGFPFLRRKSDQSALLVTSSVAGIAPRYGPLSRSVSDNTDLLIQGKPRPCDIAPAVYTDAEHVRRKSATIPARIVSSENLLHQDMVHCGAKTDDALKKDEDQRYYNTSSSRRFFGNARRRHSIGSFLHRDKPQVSTEKPSLLELKNGKENTFRKRCFKKFLNERGKTADELDVLFVCSAESNGALLWIDYLTSCFQQICKDQNKPPFKLLKLEIEDTFAEKNFAEQDKFSSARLQIVLLCPIFISKLESVPDGEIVLNKILRSDKVVAMLLCITDEFATASLKTVLPSYEHWRRTVVKDQDSTFVGDFLGVAMDILSRSWQLREAIIAEQGQASFSILPKKIRVGQNKIIILMNEQLKPEDAVKIFVEKNDHRTEITNVKRRNPYTLQFSIPGSCLQVSTLVNVYLEKNGEDLGHRAIKCESRMRELDQVLRSVDNPIQFICQSFGLNTADKDHLDSFLLTMFQRNMPPNFSLFQPNGTKYHNICNEEFPTLLHFAAKYGLEKLSWQLLESPGGEQACQLRNSSHLVPAEIAEKSGHTKLANALKGYMQMTELTSVYNYLKGLDRKTPIEKQELITEAYLIPPAARPVTTLATSSIITSYTAGPYYENFKPITVLPISSTPTYVNEYVQNEKFSNFCHENHDYQVPKNGAPCTPSTPESPYSSTQKFGTYLEMNTSVTNNFGSANSFNAGSDGLDCVAESAVSISEVPDVVYKRAGHTNGCSSREKLSAEDELLEILNDFKNNVFTITEVEKLVDSWQKRNDVQQSFREKQEQLNKMREEYEKIQQKMREHMKRPTPFEKIRKFFGRNKSKRHDTQHDDRTSVSSDNSKTTVAQGQGRPPSSISLQSSSSSSSGTTSVVSGHGTCSDGFHQHATKNHGCQEKKSNIYTELPHPPRHLDLSTTPDVADHYSQLDCVICKTVNRSLNSNNSVLIDIIHESVDEESSRAASHENLNSGSKSNDTSKTSIDKSISKKSKSAENLLNGREYANIDLPSPRAKCGFSMDNVAKSSAEHEDSKITACEALCNESMKCLTSITCTLAMEEEVGDELSFKFENAVNSLSVTNISECDSRLSASPSEFCRESPTKSEETDSKDEKSWEMNFREDPEHQTEASPIYQNFPKSSLMPEYANIKVPNSLSSQFKTSFVRT